MFACHVLFVGELSRIQPSFTKYEFFKLLENKTIAYILWRLKSSVLDGLHSEEKILDHLLNKPYVNGVSLREQTQLIFKMLLVS